MDYIHIFSSIWFFLLKNWKYMLLIFISVLTVILVIILVFSFYIIKLLKIRFDKRFFGMNNYPVYCQNILKKYKNYKIKNIYLAKAPVSKYKRTLLDIITFYKVSERCNKCKYVPNHTYLIIELNMGKGKLKHLLIEKTNCLKILSNYEILDDTIMKKIKIKKKCNLEWLLNSTKERIGVVKFFNYSLFENNCQIFIIDILETLNKLTRGNKDFVYQTEFYNKDNLKFSECNNYVINSFINIANIIESVVNFNYI
jgi:hypothetical protein